MARRAAATRARRAAKTGAGSSVASAATLAAPIKASSDSLKISALPGRSATAKLVVTAIEDCSMSAKALSEGNAFSVLQPRNSVALKASETAEIEVQFAPKATGDIQGELRLAIETASGTLTLEQRVSVPVVGYGGTFESGNGDVRVEITGDVGGTPRAKPPRKAPPRRQRTKKAPPESIPFDVFDAGDYSVDELGQRCLDKMIAAMTKLDGALEIFGTVASTPSENEAERTSAGALAIGRAGDLLVKLAAKPLLSTLPGGGALYETLKTGLKVAKDVRGSGKASRRAGAANLLKDFTTAYRGQVTDTRAALEASQQEVKIAIRRELAAIENDDALEKRKLALFEEGTRLETALNSELSVTSLFTNIVSSWMTASNTDPNNPNRLIIDLNEDWSLITGFLKGPSGDRCAEQLMLLHGGSLNVRMLGLPIQVRWFPGGEKDQQKPVRSYVSAELSSDGTLEGFGAFLIWKKELAQIEMVKNLKSRGIPQVTKLVGSKA